MGSIVCLIVTSIRAYTKGDLPGLLLPAPSSLWWTFANPHLTGDPPTLADSFPSVFCGVTAPFLWVFVNTKFCLCPLRLESLFPPILWKSCNQIPLNFKVRFPENPRFLVPFSDPQAGKPDVGFRTVRTVWELLWYYCSPVCGSLTWRIWDLIWLWLCSSYCLPAAPSLSLDMGCFYLMGSSALLLMVVQQLVAILVFLEEERSVCLSTLLNWTGNHTCVLRWDVKDALSVWGLVFHLFFQEVFVT